MAQTERFIATWDLHWGTERRSGHRVALHDLSAWNAVLAFAHDFKPHHWICGGDMLDCGSVSHHNKHKPRRTEGMRLLVDAKEMREAVITPIEETTLDTLTYIKGNHEDWIEDVLDDQPALEGILSVQNLLDLSSWNVIETGGYHRLGKLFFIHGDQIGGGVNAAKSAVEAYEQNIRLGHFHTHQVATKTSAVDTKLGKTGIVVPCLCTKDPRYNESKPNRWAQGFLYGYIRADGTFSDYVVTIISGTFTVNGKTYTG